MLITLCHTLSFLLQFPEIMVFMYFRNIRRLPVEFATNGFHGGESDRFAFPPFSIRTSYADSTF
jgi:hypothetical protein